MSIPNSYRNKKKEDGKTTIKLGELQSLIVVKKVDFGVYLAEDTNSNERVFLPAKQVPENISTGDTIEVFVYRDSKDRLISTTNMPMLTLGGLAVLKVSETSKIGAFLDWGLEKDLLLPFKQQTKRVREGEECLVTLYIDKSNRLCASMNVYDALSTNSPYVIEDSVTGRIYEKSDNLECLLLLMINILHLFRLKTVRVIYRLVTWLQDVSQEFLKTENLI